MSSAQSPHPESPIAGRPTSKRAGAQRRAQKHNQGPKQVLGVAPIQASCEE